MSGAEEYQRLLWEETDALEALNCLKRKHWPPRTHIPGKPIQCLHPSEKAMAEIQAAEDTWKKAREALDAFRKIHPASDSQ